MTALRMFTAICTLTVTLGISGCCCSGAGCSAEESPAESKEDASTPEERADQLAAGLLAAFSRRDYRAFRGMLPEDMAAKIARRDFETSVKNITGQFGEVTGCHPLAGLETPGFVHRIWRVSFRRKAVSGKGEIRQDLLFRMVAGVDDGTLRPVTFGFL